MTKATILAVTTFVWTAGFAATGAFVYTVTKPLPKPTTITVASMPPQRMPHTPPQGTIVLAPIEIVGSVPQPAPPAPVHASIAAAVPVPRVIHCSDWRPLEQGSASVQICE